MKNTMVLLFGILILGCTQTPIEHDAPKTVFISGKIENPKTDIALFRAGEGKLSISDTAYVDSTGHFSTTFNIKEEMFGNFYHGGERTSMFLVPGDSIGLFIDTKEFDETITYQGAGAAANNYLAKTYLINEINTPSYPELYSMEPDSFLVAVDALQALLTEHLDLYKSKNPNYSEKLTKKEEIEIVYKYAMIKLNYAENHKDIREKDIMDIQPSFYEFMSGLNVNDTALFRTNRTYYSFIKAFLNKEVHQNLQDVKGPKNAIVKLQTKIKIAHTLFRVKEISEKLIYSSIRTHLLWQGSSSMEKIIKDFETTSDNEENKIEVRELYDQMQLLAEGNDAPVFAYPNIEGDTIALNDFLGKYIYVDVWATWCGPCRRELPYLEKLQEEYIDKNIVFLSVSIDEDQDAWEEMVTDKEMKGVQLIATGGWQAQICKDYVIRGIPRFLLIDMEGKIITGRAERPSGKIEEILKTLEGISS